MIFGSSTLFFGLQIIYARTAFNWERGSIPVGNSAVCSK